MNDHEGFLRAIFKQPDDKTARLVYADWLDEHDHPGGELIRVRHQLSLLDPKKPKRALLARERKLVKACDQDWLERLEHADWKLRFLAQNETEGVPSWISQREKYWMAPNQEAVIREIAAVEKELGKPLPRSWKAFAHGCGPGWLLGFYGLAVPSQEEVSGSREWMPLFRALPVPDTTPEYFWLRTFVLFGSTCEGGELAWDTSKITDPIRNEYEVVELDRRLERDRVFDSFEAFWTATFTPSEFTPSYRDDSDPPFLPT